ncbi:hypothetical protein AO067_14755 [Pseudomonas viridiflava ICMP 13104]|uniref:Uncharacterized protein n=1 Tax=Pseudomonas viridiflava ICMP 13104 TaxID=1198305 RepID=A0A0W0H536_PSEVI|nr:hypothetical protein AO067_14755 [Pseudomonas viridiflava ICMP 13104]
MRSVDAYVATGNDRGRKVFDVGGHGRFTTAGDDLVVLAAVGFGQQVDVVADLKTGQQRATLNALHCQTTILGFTVGRFCNISFYTP